jgi:hypothetical protein
MDTNFKMNQSRLFMIQDIVAMGSWHPDRLDVFETMTDEGLYTLWLDLMNLTMTERVENANLY